jgi:hypothetical protein
MFAAAGRLLRSSPRLALLVAALAAPACRPVPAVPAAASSSVAPQLEEESEVARYLRDALPELGVTRADIAALLGGPDSVSVTTVANRHDPAVTDSVLTLFYDGLSAVVYRAGYDGKEMLAALEITQSRHLRSPAGAGIGATAEDVIAALGRPDSGSDEYLEFTCAECLIAGHETVRFVLSRGAVARIEIRHWID